MLGISICGILHTSILLRTRRGLWLQGAMKDGNYRSLAYPGTHKYYSYIIV